MISTSKHSSKLFHAKSYPIDAVRKKIAAGYHTGYQIVIFIRKELLGANQNFIAQVLYNEEFNIRISTGTLITCFKVIPAENEPFLFRQVIGQGVFSLKRQHY